MDRTERFGNGPAKHTTSYSNNYFRNTPDQFASVLPEQISDAPRSTHILDRSAPLTTVDVVDFALMKHRRIQSQGTVAGWFQLKTGTVPVFVPERI